MPALAQHSTRSAEEGICLSSKGTYFPRLLVALLPCVVNDTPPPSLPPPPPHNKLETSLASRLRGNTFFFSLFFSSLHGRQRRPPSSPPPALTPEVSVTRIEQEKIHKKGQKTPKAESGNRQQQGTAAKCALACFLFTTCSWCPPRSLFPSFPFFLSPHFTPPPSSTSSPQSLPLPPPLPCHPSPGKVS